MTTRDKIILNALFSGIVAVSYMIYRHLMHGEPINVKFFYILPLFMPVAGLLIWLRWDWAPEKRRQVRAQRRAEEDADKFE